MKKITNKILWIFAIGQFGWSLLSGIITNWLVYYYTDETAGIFGGNITTGSVVLGITLFGLITMVGRIFDAITDPLIASWSDRSSFKGGRRIPFMRVVAIPFAAVTCAVFVLPQTGSVLVNDVLVFVTLMLFYLFMTIYCTPYNALISELGNDEKNRINVSTYISFTYILGLSISFLIPNVAGMFEGSLGKENAIRAAIGVMCAVATAAMIFPAMCIKERDYIASTPVQTDAFTSLFKSFKNVQFARFVASDVIYFFAVTLFQTGLPFYETKLMEVPDTFTFALTVIMTVVSLCLYPVVNKLSLKKGKKKMIVVGFFAYAMVFFLASICGKGLIWGIAIAVCAGLPMAILGILPQAVVADIAETDAYESGEERSGMFFAARTFAMKMGQAISMLVFTSVVARFTTADGIRPFGYRLTAVIATVFCLVGAVLFLFYNEKLIMEKLAEKKRNRNK